jgi:uncharacterized protein YegL
MTSLRKFALAALPALALGFGAAAPASAATQLGFVLDRSGSIGSTNWTTIVNGLASAVQNFVPTDGTYELSVVTFANGATANIANRILTAANLAQTVADIQGIVFTGGGTDLAAGLSVMNATLNASQNSGPSYVNLATDGVANSNAAALAARNAMVGAGGVDNISIEGIGGFVDTNFLQNSICFPGPCTIAPVYNFPAQGFYIAVADAAGYATAIGEKIQVVVNVPEPMSLALFGMGLAGLGLAMRRRA